MVKVQDVIYAIIKQIKLCVRGSKHYLGGLPERYSTPCFLYLMAFDGDVRFTKYTKDTTLDLQVIYFNTKDDYNQDDYEIKLKVMDELKQFLSTFQLKVGDRVVKFDYTFGNADGQLTINIKFKFKDGVVNIEEKYDLIKNVFINGKEV